MKQRFKSLEMHGYKTFASKTKFEFPDQITAIVGPNGSGKSNIADSVRWVLGEQAYSLLRGKKTIDMIFSGSESRPRSSMASVTIVFNNDDNWLPIEYSEVSITRRAYRSGENEYLLNNTRVRLKEINELLANSGLSERTYTIIGQGLVDTALSIRPEERRRFFEEAAGIELYRSRRDEAIQKLDNTRRNMERIQDILSELEPRLKSLDKQAERSKEYERIKSDLFVLLRDWYGYQWSKSQDELSYTLTMQHSQEEQYHKAKEKQDEIDLRIVNLRNEINSIRLELGKWHQKASEFHTQKEQNNKNLAIFDERKKSLEDKKRDVQQQLTILEEESKARNEQFEDLRKEKIIRIEDLQKATEALKLITLKISDQQEQQRRIETKIDGVRKQTEQAETRQVQINAQINEIEHRILLLEKNNDEILKTIENGRKESQEIEKRIEILKSSVHDSLNEKNAISEKIVAQIHSIQELETEFKRLQEVISQQKANKLSLLTKMDVLVHAEQSLIGFTSGSKIVIDAAKTGKLPGRYNLFLQKIQVPIKYEIAIASILGEILEALVLDSSTNIEKALGFLAETESGRTVLLPEDSIKSNLQKTKPKLNDAIMASEIVNSEPEYREIVDALFNGIYIVENRNIAKKLLKTIGAECRIVTLSGEVFYPNGMIIAGKEIRVKAISRKREKDNLELQIAQIEKEIQLLD